MMDIHFWPCPHCLGKLGAAISPPVPKFPVFQVKIIIFAVSFLLSVCLIAAFPGGVTPEEPCKADHLNTVTF